MDDRQENKLSMYLAVRLVVTGRAALWSGVPAFVAAEAAFGAEVTNIQSLGVDQISPSSGATADKEARRRVMGDKAMYVIGPTKTLASVTGNGELAAGVNFTMSDFLYGRDTLASENANAVHARVAANQAALADYGLVAADTTALRTAIDAYVAIIARPRELVTNSAVATEQLGLAFPRADMILEDRLDNLMELYRLSQATFYQAYHIARRIIDTGGPSTPPSP